MSEHKLVVCDASPLIALAQVRALSLLPEMFARIVVPAAVRAEVMSVARAEWLEVESVTSVPPALAALSLDRGEKEAIALALQLNADFILIDETRGREAAKSFGLHVTGTVGILAAAKRAGLLAEVRPLLDELNSAHHFWLTRDFVEKTLRDLGEL